ncbi:LPXTG cell wall anchor domain-containing protein [Actinoplanes solisilvae]|uniref:LPXTG cell wall anchor domain-containing protein n=1 Tax=Actinoplanes solisilvae TaxID=2486853 RepID=UPI000FD9FAD0|nr:LPXTG cell wall anchor domain-containing protein [Actinoplanes solisilvae]
MTTESVPADDPRRLLADVRALAHRVRVDQRMTWAALLVLGAMTLLAIPFDWFGMQVDCNPDGSCTFARRGMLYFWPPAMVLAYATIAFCYLRAARTRGLGARVLPYAITGAVTTVVFPAAWLAVHLYFQSHPYPDGPLPYWFFVLDRLVMPWGMIGVALLVLAWLERNVGLLLFTAGYLALVLLVLPMNDGFGAPHFGIRAGMAVPQLIAGLVLLLGAFVFARRRRRSL